LGALLFYNPNSYFSALPAIPLNGLTKMSHVSANVKSIEVV